MSAWVGRMLQNGELLDFAVRNRAFVRIVE
jgi:hypothetical protein